MYVNMYVSNDERVTVNVTRVIDGDTFVADVSFNVLGNVFILKEQHFRMEGINAPERKGETKELGEASRAFLESVIGGKTVEVVVPSKEKYGRWLATVYLGDLDVNGYMVQQGYAVFREY